MASLKSIQSITLTFGSTDATASQTIPTAVDTSKSIVFWNASADTTNSNQYCAISSLTSTGLTLIRGTTGVALTVSANIVEFSSGVSVQHLIGSRSSDTTLSCSSVTMSETFLVNNFTSPNNTFNAFTRARLTSSTEIEYDTSATANYSIQVVSYSGSSVQRGVLSGWGSTSTTVDISSVDRSKSFILFSGNIQASGSGRPDRHTCAIRFVDDDTIGFERGNAGDTATINWSVITLNDGSSCQQTDWVNASGANPAAVSISTIDTSKSILVLAGMGHNSGTAAGVTGSTSYGQVACTLALTSTSASVARSNGTNNFTARGSVIRFAASSSGVNGTLSASVAPALSGAGAAVTRGTLSASVAPAIAISAASIATSTLSAALPLLGLSAVAGASASVGVLSGELPLPTLSAQSAGVAVAELNASVPAIALSAQSTALNLGVLSGELPRIAIAASAAAVRSCALSSALPLLGFAAQGTAVNAAVLSAPLPAPDVNAIAGTGAISGTLSASFGPQLSAQSVRVRVAAFSASTPLLVAGIAGETDAPIGTLSAELSLPELSAIATEANTSIFNSGIPECGLSGSAAAISRGVLSTSIVLLDLSAQSTGANSAVFTASLALVAFNAIALQSEPDLSAIFSAPLPLLGLGAQARVKRGARSPLPTNAWLTFKIAGGTTTDAIGNVIPRSRDFVIEAHLKPDGRPKSIFYPGADDMEEPLLGRFVYPVEPPEIRHGMEAIAVIGGREGTFTLHLPTKDAFGVSAIVGSKIYGLFRPR